ncbi:MAG TPA: hypothetical protein VMH87_19990 [Pseudomonadales bacterium]|nr:hypothetical protein [Pseudomonadales bacterium]
MRKILWITFGFWLCGLLCIANAETYQLADGTSVSGDIISANDDGVLFHTTDDKYSDRIPWTKFSQDGLKTLVKNPKAASYAEPFIETPPPVHTATEVHVHNVARLELPPKGSVIGGLFSSSLGIIVILLIYGANIYAGYEVAVFRARPPAVVMGLSAVLPIVGPIIFLSMPTLIPPGATEEDMQTETGAPPEAIAPAGVPAAQTQTTESVQVTAASSGWKTTTPSPAAAAPAAPSYPAPEVFQRGQFTFNKRFIETKFSGFFGMVRTGANKDMVLVIKTGKGQYVADRITRISANDAHFEVVSGASRQEVMISFGEIQEMQLKHKDA